MLDDVQRLYDSWMEKAPKEDRETVEPNSLNRSR
jgi:hypothetical protein